MARARAVSKYRVPYLTESAIEADAQLMLAEWNERFSPISKPPVLIEEMLECLIGLDFEIDDLGPLFGDAGVLGVIWFGRRLVQVDHGLDPKKDPRMLGRYRFTIAHEIGHWRLHRQHLAADPNAAMLFDPNGKPAFVCRDHTKPPEEHQADKFAGYALMPKHLVREAWRTWQGTDGPVLIADLPKADLYRDPEANKHSAMERFCKPLAEQFQVSAQAMRIRLEKLNLLVEQIEPTLF